MANLNRYDEIGTVNDLFDRCECKNFHDNINNSIEVINKTNCVWF